MKTAVATANLIKNKLTPKIKKNRVIQNFDTLLLRAC